MSTTLTIVAASVLVAAVTYALIRMRFGSEITHVHHMISHSDDAPEVGPDADPVCGMLVPEGEGFEAIHESVTYRLCSNTCLRVFENDPSSYVETTGASEP